jgi:tRNA-dihydrouridine synthase
VAAIVPAGRSPARVPLRAGGDATDLNAPDLAKRMEDAGAAAVAVHGRTAAQSYSGFSDWDFIARVAQAVAIPVFGSGDCVAPEQVVERLGRGAVSGVLVGRGALRNPWIFQQADDMANGRPARVVSDEDRARFLLEYIDLLLNERVHEASGFRHVAPGQPGTGRDAAPARGRERWVINKLRALNSWYTKGLDNGSHLRAAINAAESIAELQEIIESFFAGATVRR